jgi:hypothetical protein
MATLKLMRPDEQSNRSAAMVVFLNGQPLGSILNGETKIFDIPAGSYKLDAKIESQGSRTRKFSISSAGLKSFVISSAAKANAPEPLLSGSFLDVFIGSLLLLYYFTVGHNRYLNIEESAFT